MLTATHLERPWRKPLAIPVREEEGTRPIFAILAILYLPMVVLYLVEPRSDPLYIYRSLIVTLFCISAFLTHIFDITFWQVCSMLLLLTAIVPTTFEEGETTAARYDFWWHMVLLVILCAGIAGVIVIGLASLFLRFCPCSCCYK